MLLVTGGTGFVGGHVVRALREAGKGVRCLVRDRRRAEALEGLGCEIAEGDMTEPGSLRRAVQGIESVVHLVAIRQGKEEQFERIIEQGHAGPPRPGSGGGRTPVRAHERPGHDRPDEGSRPVLPGEVGDGTGGPGSGLPHVIFRPSFVFGPDGGILPTFRRLAKLAPVTPIAGSGEQRLQPIWVDDVASYFVRALEDEAATNRTFELGGPEVVSWNELWGRLKQALGVHRPSIHVPMAFMRANAFVTERLPGDIPLTRDLLKMMEAGDNIVTSDDAGRVFALPLLPLDEQLRRSA